MNALLQILLEITIYSFILFAVIILFKKLFRKHISPMLGYAVWALLILRLIIPVTFDSQVKLFVIPEAAQPQGYTQVTESAQQAAQPASIEQSAAAEPVHDESLIPWNYINTSGLSIEPQTASNIATDTTRVPASRPISWQTALVLLWVTGAAVSAGILVLLFLRIRRKTSKGCSAPETIMDLVNACKRDMGIKANINVIVLDWLTTPALTASIKPKLLLPHSMMNGMDIRQIEYGIRHELMHYRRRDHLTALLLMLLRCVYWFNPVVWLASKQIETDMEAACDASVTASLGRLECYDYAQTMIDLGSKANACMLGMGVSSSRASMEKRVRGIFMGRRTKLPVRVAAMVLSCLLIFTCFTTACQPVQAEPASNTTIVESPTQAAAEPVPTPAPQVNPNEGYGNFPDWVETYTIPNLNVDINAQIVTPDKDVFPVYKVQKRSFDNETMQKILEYFADDIVGVRQFSYTKDELKEQLKYFKEHDAKKKDEINDLNSLIAAAQPEEFKPFDKYAALKGYLIFDRADGSRINFSGGQDSCSITKYTGNYDMQFERDIRYGSWPHLIKYMDKTLEKSKLTEQEAKDLASKALKDMGIENMGVIRADRAVIVNTCLDAFPSGGWNVSFGRADNGSVPADMSLQDSTAFNFREDDYFERWQTERLWIYVDDEGVQSIAWDNPTVVTEAVQANTALLPWDKAQQAIKDAMSLGYTNWTNIIKEHDGEVRDRNIAINKIVLTNVLVPQGDDLDYQLMVPAWVVYHGPVWEAQGQTRYDFTEIFAVNAIDGTVIDLNFRTHEMDKRNEELRKQQEQDQAAESAS